MLQDIMGRKCIMQLRSKPTDKDARVIVLERPEHRLELMQLNQLFGRPAQRSGPSGSSCRCSMSRASVDLLVLRVDVRQHVEQDLAHESIRVLQSRDKSADEWRMSEGVLRGESALSAVATWIAADGRRSHLSCPAHG